MESGDDEHVQENREMKKKKNVPTNVHRRDLAEEDSDHEDESLEFRPVDHKREIYRNHPTNSSSNDTSTPPITIDEDSQLARKQSKIGL